MLNGESYVVDVKRIREIITMVAIEKSNNCAPHVMGMINLRGSSVPVISLRRRFGLPELENDESACIAIMEFGGELAGFVFDDIKDVIRIPRRQIQPFIDALRQPWIEGIVEIGQKFGLFLNLQHLG